MNILNLTQHPASPEQVDAGVINPTPEIKAKIVRLITFNSLPNLDEINARANAVAAMVNGMPEKFGRAMIGGAPFFMGALETALKKIGIVPVYAFSQRIVEESAGGSEKKVIFKHEGFVEV